MIGYMHKIVETAMSVPLANSDSLLPNKMGWTDVVDMKVKGGDQPVYVPPYGSSIWDAIHRRLGHITVNPNNPDNTEALKAVYKFPKESCLDEECINSSTESAEYFIMWLVERAKREAALRSGKDAIHPTEQQMAGASGRLVSVTGKRGCGKTFFLNYLLAKYSDYLDSEKVIWVRLNLYDDFGDNRDVLHRVYAQISKIVLRYYDPTSPLCGRKPVPIKAGDALDAYSVGFTSREKFRSQMQYDITGMKRAFYEKDKEEPISPQLVPRELGRFVFDYARELGYSFIIVFDGIDRLEATPQHENKWKLLVKGICGLAANPTATGMVYVAVMRTNSLSRIALAGPTAYQSFANVEKRVDSGDIHSILDVRLNYLKSYAAELVRKHPKLAQELGDTEVTAHVEDFRAYLYNELDTKKVFEAFGENRRAQMGGIQLCYFQFIRIRKGLRHYLLIETLTKAGRNYPPKHYLYWLSDSGGLMKSLGTNTLFDNHFMPPAFTFPCAKYSPDVAGNIRAVPQRDGLLLGLRILQLSHAHSALIQSDRFIEPLTVKEMQELCLKLFDYPNGIVRHLLEEYHEYEFIELMGAGKVSNDARLTLVSMPKMQYLLQYLMFDLAYLNLASMRVALSFAALDRDFPYFEACTLDSSRPGGLLESDAGIRPALTRWVSTKIQNSTNLYRLLFQLNAQQKERAVVRVDRLSTRLRRTVLRAMSGDESVPGMFDFPDTMKKAILSQVLKVNQTFDYADDVTQYLQKHWRSWGTID